MIDRNEEADERASERGREVGGERERGGGRQGWALFKCWSGAEHQALNSPCVKGGQTHTHTHTHTHALLELWSRDDQGRSRLRSAAAVSGRRGFGRLSVRLLPALQSLLLPLHPPRRAGGPRGRGRRRGAAHLPDPREPQRLRPGTGVPGWVKGSGGAIRGPFAFLQQWIWERVHTDVYNVLCISVHSK